MRKATNILLLLSFILGIVACVSFIIVGISDLVQFGQASNPSVQTEGKLLFLVNGILFLVFGIVSLPALLLSNSLRKQFNKGETEKADYKKKAITLIVLGAISFELPIVPAVFLLAMKPEDFKA